MVPTKGGCRGAGGSGGQGALSLPDTVGSLISGPGLGLQICLQSVESVVVITMISATFISVFTRNFG
jgi:hypothetical protein